MDPATSKAFWDVVQNQKIGELTLERGREILWDIFKQETTGTNILELVEPVSDEVLAPYIKILLEKLNRELAINHDSPQKHTLDSIPVEIRGGIFEYLLVSTELEDASSISQSKGYGGTVNYGLSPQILLVCRLFYKEGRDILYGRNHFIVESLPDIRSISLDLRSPTTVCSPLTRWGNPIDGNTPILDTGKSFLMRFPSLKYVKKWKLILSGHSHDPRSEKALVEWCSSLCEWQHMGQCLMRELEVCIIPEGVEDDIGIIGENFFFYANLFSLITTDISLLCIDTNDIREILAPLELLRGLTRTSIRTACISELPDFVCSNDWKISPLVTKAILPSKWQRKQLVDLLQGTSGVELKAKMFAALEKYAITFERDAQFKKDMTMSSRDLHAKSPQELAILGENPYCTSQFHPRGLQHTVELSLGYARYMADASKQNITETTQFKKHRSIVLQYLERQFRNIERTSNELVDFIKRQKRERGIFDPKYISNPHGFDLINYTEALILLEDCAAAFSRELDPSTTRAVRAQLGLFQARYDSMPREMSLKKCELAYRMHNEIAFRLHFRDVVESMDHQYYEILEARSAIYEWDLRDHIPDITITRLPSREDWKIRWAIREPNVTVPTQSEML